MDVLLSICFSFDQPIAPGSMIGTDDWIFHGQENGPGESLPTHLPSPAQLGVWLFPLACYYSALDWYTHWIVDPVSQSLTFLFAEMPASSATQLAFDWNAKESSAGLPIFYWRLGGLRIHPTRSAVGAAAAASSLLVSSVALYPVAQQTKSENHERPRWKESVRLGPIE